MSGIMSIFEPSLLSHPLAFRKHQSAVSVAEVKERQKEKVARCQNATPQFQQQVARR